MNLMDHNANHITLPFYPLTVCCGSLFNWRDILGRYKSDTFVQLTGRRQYDGIM